MIGEDSVGILIVLLFRPLLGMITLQFLFQYKHGQIPVPSFYVLFITLCLVWSLSG